MLKTKVRYIISNEEVLLEVDEKKTKIDTILKMKEKWLRLEHIM